MSESGTRKIQIEMEELGFALNTALEGAEGWVNGITAYSQETAGMVTTQFTTYVAAGAPRRVTVSASAPATWYHHILRDIAQNAAIKSRTAWATVFGYWLERKVKYQRIYNYEDVNRNVCPHFKRPASDKRHLEFLVRGSDEG